MKNEQFFSDKEFLVRKDCKEIRIVPKAVESCMVPNTFHITPIRKMETNSEIVFESDGEIWNFPREEVESGQLVITEIPFEPKAVRKKNGCSPCTNCGQCSW